MTKMAKISPPVPHHVTLTLQRLPQRARAISPPCEADWFYDLAMEHHGHNGTSSNSRPGETLIASTLFLGPCSHHRSKFRLACKQRETMCPDVPIAPTTNSTHRSAPSPNRHPQSAEVNKWLLLSYTGSPETVTSTGIA